MRLVMSLFVLACNPADTSKETETAPPEDSGDTEAVEMVTGLEASIHETVGSIVEVTWEQAADASVSAAFSFGGETLETPTWDLSAGSQRILLIGAPYDTVVTWQLNVGGEAVVADDDSIQTDDPPDGVPIATLISSDASAIDGDARYVMTSLSAGWGGSAWTVILDREARLVWAHETPTQRTSFQSQLSYDKTEFLIDYNSFWGAYDGGVASQVAVVNVEGEEVEIWNTYGMAHPFTQLPDGAIVWGGMASADNYGYTEDLWIAERGKASRKLFDCEAFLDSIGEEDLNCGSNAINWNESTQTILYSNYSIESVIEVTRDGELVRYFGHINDAWAFADDKDAFWWQHGAHYLDNGNLLLSTKNVDDGDETLAREYELDTENQQLVAVWSAGHGEGVYGDIMGEARRLSNGNTLHNFGSTARFREYAPDGSVVWDVSWADSGSVGHIDTLGDFYGLWSPE